MIVIGLTHVSQNMRHQTAEGIRKYLWQRDPEFAQQCLIGAIEYARFENEQEDFNLKRQITILKSDNENIKNELNETLNNKNKFREHFFQATLSSDIQEINFQSHSSWYLLSPCLMIPDGSRESSHILLLSRTLTLFFEYEQEKNKREHRRNSYKDAQIHYKLPYDFGKRFAEYLFELHHSNFQDYIDILRIGCEKMPRLIHSVLLYVAEVAERKGEKEVYWKLWQELSQTVQNIAIKLANTNFDRQESDKRQLIRGMLHADFDWQRIDYENQDIALGKDLILEFVENAGKNSDVFASLASLMYHFPSIFCESGLPILAKHQQEEGSTRLISSNTAFYLAMAIQSFLQMENTGSLPKKLHESCFILLNIIIETASSRAYYLREHLIRSRKIV